MMNYSADKLIDIAIALSAEKDTDRLLDRILREAMVICNSDGGTLYLKQGDFLYFHDTYIGSGPPDEEVVSRTNNLPPVPLTREYVSACAALDKKRINVADVYESTEYDFSGARKYDAINNYRTQSMLVLPMEDDRGEVLGVLQLINALGPDGSVIPFAKEKEEIIMALSSLAAVSLTNRRLSDQVLLTLHSFVEVMVEAVDARSTYNANHTRSMVQYAGRFLDYLEEQGKGWFDTPEERDSFLMSVWLHDIGKLIIPLEIMDKPSRLFGLKERVYSRVRTACLLEELRTYKHPEEADAARENIAKMESAWELIDRSDKAGYLPDDTILALHQAAEILCLTEDKRQIPLLNDEELTAITVQKGTLTPTERGKMQDHVVYTGRMLDKMHFEGVYEKVPFWASSHHELIDGSGYPKQLAGDQIPREVRLLTIIDVYDALTAEDRPYKPPMPAEKALSILKEMVGEGKLDGDILSLFIESNAWKKER